MIPFLSLAGACEPAWRLSHAPLQVSIEEDPGPAETVDCQPPLHRFTRVTGHRSRVSDHASFSSSLLTSLPHYFLAPSSLSPLDATLMLSLASVANKRLTAELNSLDATLTKNRGWGALPFDVLTPIPANVSNLFPIYPLCFHTLVALTGSTALEQLFSNQPVTHSFRRDGGCTPSRTLPIFSASLSTVPSHESPGTSHQSRITGHGSCLPLSTTVQSTTPSLMYIVPGLSSPLFVRGIARCLGGRHEQNIEDCPHRRRRAGRSSSRRAVFDSRQSIPPHH